MISNITNKRILIAPLNWGLGHATRDVSIIRDLLKNENEVFVAGNLNTIRILNEEFPDLTFILFPSFSVKYSKQFLILKLIFSLPYFLFQIAKEHFKLKKIIKDYEIDVVISDNRFGLWNKKVRSIFITHQIMIKLPNSIKLFESLIYKLNNWFIKHYDECWIPDFEHDENLSGDLSHKYKKPKNAKFIGAQSRFILPEEKPEEKEKLLVLLSGPEPHRTFLENQIIEQTKNIEIPTLIVRGLPHETQEMKQIHKNVFAISHFNSKILMREILTSKYIICRAGYSTIMDLHTLQKKAIIIPTPQQTEQEYLAEYLHKKKIFFAVNQENLMIQDVLKNKYLWFKT